MTRTIVLMACMPACLVLASCTGMERGVVADGSALAGAWHVTMRDASAGSNSADSGQVALVTVRRTPGLVLTRQPVVAIGAIAIAGGTLAKLIPDGSRVTARWESRDSVALVFASPRGDYQVVLSGVLRGDTLSGEWRGELARISGASGRFTMIRRR